MGRTRTLAHRHLPPNLYCRNGYYCWRDPRTQVEYGLGRDKRDAISQAIEANALVAQPSFRLVDRLSGKSIQTFGQWLDRYDAILLQRGLKPSSLSTSKAYLAAAKTVWANRLICEINIQDVADLLQMWVEKDQLRMAAHVRSKLVDVFREAMAAGWISSNPAEVTKVHGGGKAKRSRLTIEQFRLLHAWSLSSECEWVWLPKLLEIGILTGQRREDLSQFKFSDCRDGHLWFIQNKTATPMALSLDLTQDELPGMTLGSVIESCKAMFDTDFILHHGKTSGKVRAGQKIFPSLLSHAFATARKAVGIDDELEHPPTLHEMRSLSGRLYELKYGKDFVQALWGHKNPNTSAIYLDSRGSAWTMVKPIQSE